MQPFTNPEEVDLLRQNARSMVRELGLLNDSYFEIGVTLAERHLLIELSSLESPTFGDIAKRLLLDKSTTSRLIAKAAKKGYVRISTDTKDKRRRFLHFTPLGQKTLNTFEPIAHNQTKQALDTLSPHEVNQVYRGVSLYAQGLKNSRLQQKSAETPIEPLKELHQQLVSRGYLLRLFSPQDEEALYAIFKEVVETGSQFPYESSSFEEFRHHFFDPKCQVYVCVTSQNEVAGGFYLRANYSGRCSHIANAAYMIHTAHRGRGLGSLLAKASLQIAKELGFRSMQYNMVLSQNIPAVKLYEKLGFTRAGILPDALRNPDGSYQDGYILHRNLRNL